MEHGEVVILTARYPPPFNANAVRALYMAKAFRNKGYNVTIIPFYGAKTLKGHFGEKIVTLDREIEPKASILKRAYDILRKHLNIDKIVNVIKELEPSYIIATLPPVEAIPVGFKVSKKLKIPLITDVQDLADEYRVMERPYLTPLIRLYFSQVYRGITYSKLVATTTEYMAEVIARKTGNKNIIVVPNGVDMKLFNNCLRKEKSENALTAVFLGDLNWKYHRIEAFIKAIRFLKKQNVIVKLDIIGTGKVLPHIKKLVNELELKDQVTIHGYLDYEKAFKIMSNADFGIAGRPARDNLWIKTSMRLTIYEYLACGLPIVAYGPPKSYTEYFINKHNAGIYIPSDDPQIIAKTLLRKLDYIKSIKPMHLRKIAMQFDWNKIMNMFVERVAKL